MEKRAQIVTFTSRKGGVGKTVCTTLLARYYAEVEGKSVIVVDLDASCGITSIFYDKPLNNGALSVVDLLRLASNNRDVRDAFEAAVIPTGMENNHLWENNGGQIYLLPSRETLDQEITKASPLVLREILTSLALSEKFIILVDTGPEHRNVQVGISAADIVFLPIMFSRQDVYPAVDTLRAIIQEQQASGNAVLGGLVINDFGDTKWEQDYADNFLKIFLTFQEKTSLVCTTDEIFIPLKRSKIIKRGKYLDWSFREEFKEAAVNMAAAVQAYEDITIGAF